MKTNQTIQNQILETKGQASTACKKYNKQHREPLLIQTRTQFF